MGKTAGGIEDIRELFRDAPLEEKSLAALQINSYLRIWQRTAIISREKNGHTVPEMVPIKASEFVEQQLCLAAGLLELGVEKGDTVAIYSPNSARYAIELFAILAIGAVFVPVYPTTTEEEVDLLLRHSESRFVFAGDLMQFQKAFSILNKVKSPLKKLIVNYHVDTGNPGVISYDELIRLGRRSGRLPEAARMLRSVTTDDLAALIYTPGTTGIPKGALLTHGNFLAQRRLLELFRVTDKDVRLAHLPFSHVFGLSADLFSAVVTGSLLCIMKSFETEEVLEYIREVRPTIICSVPRMYEKICVNVIQGLQQYGWMRRSLATLAMKVGRGHYIARTSGRRAPLAIGLAKKLLYPQLRRIRSSLGMGRMRILVSGGGPLPLEIAYFFGGIGLPVTEGYGLTETAPIINVNRLELNKPGTVGPPLDGVIEKISDEGEILVKGPTVFKGYYKSDEENEIAFTPDGFFRTGDIGIFDEDGYLRITGRIKDLLITSSGKNVAPLYIEKKFENEPYINYICVVGDRRKYLTALVVPDFARLRAYARERNIKFQGDEDLVAHPEVLAFYKERVGLVNETLARYEQIKKFTLLPNDFSVNGGELSPTFKFRRHYVHEKYRDLIDTMYPSSDSIPDEL